MLRGSHPLLIPLRARLSRLRRSMMACRGACPGGRVSQRLGHIGLILAALCGRPLLAPAQEAVPAETTSDTAQDRAAADSERPARPFVAPAEKEIHEAIERGVDFLLEIQKPDGSWGSATKTKGLNIYAPIPGAHDAFRTAVTALCISALIEVKPDDARAIAAVDRGEAWLLEHLPELRRATSDALYNVWGHAYAIQALVRLHRREQATAGKRERFEALIREQFDWLTRYESVDGGWGYYDFRAGAQKPTSSSISFVNATVLIAMKEADVLGVPPPQKIVDRAIAAIRRQQKPDFTYLYGEYLKDRPMRGINRPGGSLGRSQACNAALRAWGADDITDAVLKDWLQRLYDRNGWLDIGRKRPIPHESWFQVAGYFYYYGHYYGALCVEFLSLTEREPYQGRLARLMIDRQEKTGCWWDYPLYDYHRQYGTAFALMTLKRCLP